MSLVTMARWFTPRHCGAVSSAMGARYRAHPNAHPGAPPAPNRPPEVDREGPMTETTFAPPGAGQWTAESAHAYGAMTPIGQHLMRTGMTKGVAQTFAEYGMPAETLDCRFVHGHMYTRLRPLVAPDRTATRPPPKVLLRLMFRVHPEL